MYPTKEVINQHGQPITEASICAAAKLVFEGAEYEARMDANAARVEAEEKEHGVDVPRRDRPQKEDENTIAITSDCHRKLPGNVPWDTLLVVDCRVCRKRLLSPRCELIRKEARRAQSPVYKIMPPPAAGTIRQTFYGPDGAAVVVQFFVCKTCMES